VGVLFDNRFTRASFPMCDVAMSMCDIPMLFDCQIADHRL